MHQRVGIALTEVRLQVADGKVHLAHLPRVGIDFLTIDRDIVDKPLVVLDEVGTLHEHTATTTGGVIDTSLERLYDCDQRADDAGGSVELAGVLAFELCELS